MTRKTASTGEVYAKPGSENYGLHAGVLGPLETLAQSCLLYTSAKFLLSSIPQQNAGAGVFETALQAETLQDNKGALRADWVHGKGTLTGYYFIDGYSLLNPYPTGTGGASVPGFSATSNGLAQLISLGHTITFGDATLNEFHLSYMRNANAVGQPQGGVGPSLVSQGFIGIVPVSYTHLDVYKRQAQCCAASGVAA